MKASQKSEKAKKKQVRALKAAGRSKCVRQDRDDKASEICFFVENDGIDPNEESPQFEHGGVVRLSEKEMVELLSPPDTARFARCAIASHVNEKALRGWRRTSITFLCCVKYHCILSRDTARYLLQRFVRPSTWSVLWEDSALKLVSPSASIWHASPPPFSLASVFSKAWDSQEKEMWIWGGERTQIMVWSAKTDAWRLVTDPDLISHHELCLEDYDVSTGDRIVKYAWFQGDTKTCVYGMLVIISSILKIFCVAALLL